ncbi:hypothetical protein SNE40_016192 [Patella caerulea]|uniref:Uncharacterized protein n=1 Tax=Patella caerulea TaxID=87958 RepID=A0AAN8J8E1_PATCE
MRYLLVLVLLMVLNTRSITDAECSLSSVYACDPKNDPAFRSSGLTLKEACGIIDRFKTCLRNAGCSETAVKAADDGFERGSGYRCDGCTIKVSMSLMFISTLLMFVKNIF